jgi:hypothetical protein
LRPTPRISPSCRACVRRSIKATIRFRIHVLKASQHVLQIIRTALDSYAAPDTPLKGRQIAATDLPFRGANVYLPQSNCV